METKRRASTAERITTYIELYGITQLDIVKRANAIDGIDVKITKTDMSHYVNGRREVTQKKLYILAKALDVNEAWLMGYDFPMKSSKSNSLDFPMVFNKKNIQFAKKYLKFIDAQTAAYFTGTLDVENLSEEKIIKYANAFRQTEKLIFND